MCGVCVCVCGVCSVWCVRVCVCVVCVFVCVCGVCVCVYVCVYITSYYANSSSKLQTIFISHSEESENGILYILLTGQSLSNTNFSRCCYR